jgi:hypothetical protein
MIRATDAKEVGVGNPAEETYRYPNQITAESIEIRKDLSTDYSFFLARLGSPSSG